LPAMVMDHSADPKKSLTDRLGDHSGVEILHNQVVVATYVRPTKTKSGIHLPDNYVDEDKFQGKVGLVVKMGNDACVDPTGKWFRGVNINLGDWIIFRPSDGWSISINGVDCRVLEDIAIKGKVDRPDRIW